MFWIIAAVVVVALGALAWWSSGRARPSGSRQDRIDVATAEAKAQARTGSNNINGPGF